ncbi:MAG: DUF4129 domain-containing protein [Runella sp.]
MRFKYKMGMMKSSYSKFSSLVAVFLMILWGSGLTQNTPPANGSQAPKALQNESPTLRKPTEQRLNKYRNDRDYDYSRDVIPPDNPVARFWDWLMKKISNFFRSDSYDSFWQYVILATVAGLALWLLYKAEFVGGLFGRTPTEDSLSYKRIAENIHELDFDSLIAQALDQKNYRLAVRLYYLKTLKLLSDKEFINWQPTKTNHAYLQELAPSSLQEPFRNLTLQFEYIWYGEFEVNETTFGILKTEFQHFAQKI